jgi:preprotein translocase subunit SecD
MALQKPLLTIVNGGDVDRSERIALSFVVYERKRLDIPVEGLLSVEASARRTYYSEEGPIHSNSPVVVISLTPEFQAKLYEFTADVVGQVVEFHVGKRCVSRPKLLERLGNEPSFHLSANDLAEAEEMAEVLRLGWSPKQIK